MMRVRSRVFPLAVLVAASQLVMASTRAQSLAPPRLVRGQDAALQLSLARPSSTALFVLGVSGLGRGACFPRPIGLCLDLLGPPNVLPPVPVSGGGNAELPFVVPPLTPLVAVQAQALVVDVVGGQLRVVKSNAVESTVQTLAAFSDDFSGTTLDPKWRVHNPHLVQVSVGGGELRLQPTQSGPPVTWYADGEGPFLYQLVRGDFTVSAPVRAYLPTNQSQPPTPTFRMGGLTVRDPASVAGRRNWLHVALGAGDGSRPVAVEDKTTVNSRSSLRLYPIASPRGEVRVTRRGATVALWYRADTNSTWRLLRSHQRPDLGPVLQVGPNVFSWDRPVLVASSFSRIRFE